MKKLNLTEATVKALEGKLIESNKIDELYKIISDDFNVNKFFHRYFLITCDHTLKINLNTK